MTEEKHVLFGRDDLARAVIRMSHEVIEKSGDAADLVFFGIRSRGVHLARRIARKVEEFARVAPPVGVLDVTPYRDDRAQVSGPPILGALEVAAAVEDKTVVLVDDVIYRGRTIRAAMDAVERFGQPKRILVAVLVDRGARELPIRADIVGKNVEAEEGSRVNVMLEESDGIDQVSLARWRDRSAL